MFAHSTSRRLGVAAALLSLVAPHFLLAAKPDTWTKLRSPNFIVVTDAGEKSARRVAYQFETIRAVFRQFFNMQGSSSTPPVTIIAVKDEAGMKPLLPEYFETKGSMHPAGVYIGGAEKNYVVLRLDVSLDREAYEPFEPVYHEYVHYLMRHMLSQLPIWLTEGLAEFYGNTRLEGKTVVVGAPSGSNLMVLRQHPLLPLPTLYAVNAASPYYHENNKASIFYAESWVLTHYLITRDWHERTRRLAQFVSQLEHGVAAEEAAKQTIGDAAALDAALETYIGHFSFTAARLDAPPEVDQASFTPEPLSSAEVLALQADFLMHDRHYAEARPMLEEALKQDPKLAAAYESMGQLYALQSKFDEATRWYSQAVAFNSQSYLAHYYYASNLLKGKLDDELAAKAEVSLRTALKINPGFAPSYEALAFLLASRNRQLQEARTLLLQAVALEPGNLHYRISMVHVLMQLDRADDALRVANLTASLAKTPEEFGDAQTTVAGARQFQEYKQELQRQEQKRAEEAAREHTAAESQPAPAETASVGEEAAGGSDTPPRLQHRDGKTDSGPYDVSMSPLPRPPARPEVLARRAEVDGKIVRAQCEGSTSLDLTLTSPRATQHLYSDNYFKVVYSALNYTPHGILNPCTDLQGTRAHIVYHPAKDEAGEGELIEVQLVK